jgi:hypothetical protein
MDIYHKRYSSCPLALIAFSAFPLAGISRHFDFRIGWPTDLAIFSERISEGERWARYLHCRVAWETGGAVGMAEALAGRVRNVAIGDDNGLEAVLNSMRRNGPIACEVSE